jgi:adenylosuccinate synthase
LLLSAGCAIDEDILVREADRLALPRERLVVDPRAVLISKPDRDAERGIADSIASTGSGTGAALVRRMSRSATVRLVKDSEKLHARTRVESVAPLLHGHIDRGGDVIVEGTQGFGLSLLHGPHYPHVTARDTTAAGFASEVGLSPRQVNEIVMVIRTFPIRVGGTSGPLSEEITWEEVQRISGSPEVLPEFTSVTGTLRRVAKFDFEAVKAACRYNQPTSLAVMGVDRLNYANYQSREVIQLTSDTKDFIRKLEIATGVKVEWLGTGFETSEAIRVTGVGGDGLVYFDPGSSAGIKVLDQRHWEHLGD